MATSSSAKSWVRWQDWGAVVLGAYTMLATMWVATTGSAISTMLVLGALLLITGVWSLAMPGSIASEYVHMGLGVLLFISPWVLAFSDMTGASWTSWVVGVLSVIVGAAALPAANSAHSGGGMAAGQH